MLIPFGTLAASGGVEGSYELISTTILGSNADSVTFSSLGTYSTNYKHLQLRFTARITEIIGGGIGTFYFNLNGDTAGNYSRHYLRGNGSAANSFGLANTATPDLGYAISNGASANIFAAGVSDFLDVFSTTKNKTVRTLSGAANPNEVSLWSGNWRSTSSLTSITLETYGAHQFMTGSRFSLYGIKG